MKKYAFELKVEFVNLRIIFKKINEIKNKSFLIQMCIIFKRSAFEKCLNTIRVLKIVDVIYRTK